MINTLFNLTLFLIVLSLPVNVFAGVWGSSNIHECLLDNLPGVKNDPAAIEIFKKCKREYPTFPVFVKKRDPLFGVKTAGECVTEYAKDVTSPKGAKWIKD